MAVHGFRRTATGRIVWRADEVERGLLRSLVTQLADFVAPVELDADADPLARMVGIDERAETHEDPALARLFPDAYPDDPEASADFRRFTERALREEKAAHARVVLACLERSGDKITLTADEASAWLGTLTDLRLALGTRMDITEDNHEELADLSEEHPLAGLFHVYDWLTFLQETLVRCLLPGG